MIQVVKGAIEDMFRWSHPWTITVRDYAAQHGHCYKFDIFDDKQSIRFLNELNLRWKHQQQSERFILVKTFGIYCMEYAIVKYRPKWLLFLDIDVAIPPQTFNRSLQSVLFQIQSAYHLSNQTFDFCACPTTAAGYKATVHQPYKNKLR